MLRYQHSMTVKPLYIYFVIDYYSILIFQFFAVKTLGVYFKAW